MKRRKELMSREQTALLLKERIYGGVTVLAVNIGLLIKTGLTVEHAFITIVSTVVGLWLAGLFAVVLSYRIVHDENMPRATFIHEVAVHRGLLLAGVSSVIMLGLASIDLISIRTAIIADISLTVVAMTIAILRSAKTKSNTFITAIISIAAQAIIAGVIILLKLGAK